MNSLPVISHAIESQFSTDFSSGEIGDEIRASIWSADYRATGANNGSDGGNAPTTADTFKNYPLISSLSFSPFPSVLADGQRGADEKESVFGGFLPEIGRVWVSVGAALYLWSTEGAPAAPGYGDSSSGGDFALFDALDEPIVSVGVAPVVPGVFVPTVSHVLCVATVDAVHILGVSLSGGLITGELSLHPTGLVAPCDGAVVLSLGATASGRIFAGCRDGRLYELVYTEPITPSFSAWLFGSAPAGGAANSGLVGSKAARRGGGLTGAQAPRAVRPSKCRKVDHSSSPLDYVLPAFLRKLVVSHDPIVQVIADDHRAVLYALSNKGALSLYDLGAAGTSFAHVATVARPLRDAATVCPRLHSVGGGNNPSSSASASSASAASSTKAPPRIVSVSLVSPEDSATVACVATASNGTRLYYAIAATPAARTFYSSSVAAVPARGQRQQPTRLHLQHVRLPPEGIGGVGSSLPVRSAAVAAGLAVVCVDGGADGGDDHLVFCVDEAPLRGEGDEEATGASSTGAPYGTAVTRRTRPSLRERVQSFTVGGYAFAALERPRAPVADPWLPSGAAPPTLPLSSAATGVPSMSPAFGLDRDLALGYTEAPREILALSGTGLYRFVRARPTDLLVAALEASRGDARGAEVAAIVQQLGAVEVCAQLLLLASSRAPDSSDARAVDHVAGEPAPAPLLPAGPLSTDLADLATHAFFTLAGSPCLEGDEDEVARATAGGGGGLGGRGALFGGGYRGAGVGGGEAPIPPALTGLIPSIGHAALLLHIARLVRPLWSYPIAQAIPGSHGVLELRVSVASLRRQERALRALLRWLMAHPQFTALPPADKALSFVAATDSSSTHRPTAMGGRGYEAPGERRRRAERALTLEREALSATLLTVTRAAEAVSLLVLLGEASFGSLVAAGGASLREAVETLSFADMVATKRGADTASLLINQLVVAYAAERLDISTVCGALQSQCESYYAATDRARFAGHELLHRAATVASYDSRQAEDLADDAAAHFVTSAGSLDWPTIAARFRRLGAYQALLRVALARGAAQDKNNLAVQVHRGVPDLDDRARDLHRQRVATYQEVLTALSELHDARRTDELSRLRHRIFESRDELLHLLVYEWHLAQKDSGEAEDALLDARPRYLEDFLRRESLDTLTKYYVRGGEAEPAARELMLAARSRTRNLSLTERVERLSRAKGCLAHVTGSGASRPHSQAQSAAALYQDVSAELEVAMVQLATQSALRELGNNSSTGTVRSSALSAAADLDKGLLGLSELFNQYAHPFDLYEMQLVIIEVARHEDARRVNIIWKKLIGQALAEGGSRAVARRVEELGRRFYPNELVFPVPFVAERLERVAERVAGGGSGTEWVVDALAEAGVPYSRLFEVYEELARTLTDLSPSSTVTLLTHQCTIIERWADELHVGRQRPRSVFTGQRVDEAIDHYCVILSGTPSPAAKSLIVSLRAVRDAVFAENA
jgi:nuclear pore complex protein Nup155